MGGKGSGNKAGGPGRNAALNAEAREWVRLRCNIVRELVTNEEAAKVWRARFPGYYEQTGRAFDGSKSPPSFQEMRIVGVGEAYSLRPTSEARSRWLKMPVGRNHKRRVKEALQEDLGLGEDETPNQARRFIAELSRVNVEAEVKRRVQDEIKKRYGVVVSIKTIGRYWDGISDENV